MSHPAIDKAVILARGLGKRMRRADDGAPLDGQQAAVAETGVKAMIPMGRPFLDYVLGALAEAGYRRVCLVVGPEHQVIREYYGRQLKPRRLSIEFAVQPEPRGTADAVAAAAAFAAAEQFLLINSDNYYPIEALRALGELEGCGVALFEQDAMLESGNISRERLLGFAIAQVSPRGLLQQILEKPDRQTLASLPPPLLVSMNCWRLGPTIFDACRAIGPSPRGEWELPCAVQYAIDVLGERFQAVTIRAPVLDLSTRADIAAVAARLAGVEVQL